MPVIAIYRAARWCHQRRVPLLPALLKAINRIAFSVVLPPAAQLGRNVLLSYQGLGTVIHKAAVIEDDVTIGSGVTIGGRSGQTGAPRIGQGTMIGTGAKVLGAIRVGRHVSIGANAVVLNDLPDYAVAVGMPARVVRINRPEDLPDYRDFS